MFYFILIKVVYLVESIKQFQQQFNDKNQKLQQQCCSCSQLQQFNHNNQFSSNSAITVIANSSKSSNSTNLLSTNTSGSLLSLLQPPKINHKKIFESMKNCLMSANKTALTKLLNDYFNFNIIKLPKQNIEEQVDLFIQKLLNENITYLSPPPSVTIPSPTNNFFFPVSTLPTISHSSANLFPKILSNEFDETYIIKNLGVSIYVNLFVNCCGF